MVQESYEKNPLLPWSLALRGSMQTDSIDGMIK